ncbi:MAG TPA: COX15/CtaA family protein [Rubrivivax sp.]|nr:COX15/CtaA family protein [Burkholderiales bacterium]HNU12279.1 COX15/CtaA family protein [Rubrivivax sp.]
MSTEDPLARRLRLVRMLAWALVALMLATVLLSAYMRLWQSGLGCEPWPDCYEQALRGGGEAAAGAGLALARLLHRAVASLVLVVALLLALATLGVRPRLRREAGLALVLLALTLGLAALGVVARGSTRPPVVLGNLLGGFLMLALALRLAMPAAARAATRLAWPALALLLLQIALGAMVSATHSTLACEGLGDCMQRAQALGGEWSLLDPWRSLAPGTDAAARGVRLQLLHRLLALLLVPVLLLVALGALRQRRRVAAGALGALLLLQLLVGGLLAPAGWPLAQVLAHNLTAALMLALLLRLS